MEDLILVPGATEEEQKHIGIQVFWGLSGVVNREALEEVIHDLELPNITSAGELAVLHRALTSLVPRNDETLVRKLPNKAKGYSVLFETKDALDLDTHEVGEATHKIELTVKIEKQGDATFIRCNPVDHPLAQAVRDRYNYYSTVHSWGAEVSQWLTTRVMPSLNALKGRPRGGFYFLPAGDEVAKFHKIKDALTGLQSASGSIKLYVIPAMRCDGAVEACTDALIAEVDSVMNEIESALNEDIKRVSVFENRRQYLRTLEAKVAKFSEVLGDGFEDLKIRMADMDNVIGAAECAYEVIKEEKKKERKTA